MFLMVRNGRDSLTCSLSGDTVEGPCLLLTTSGLLCTGQRKRDRLQSLEARVHASGTNTISSFDEETQPQYPMQFPLPGLETPSMPITPPFNSFEGAHTVATDTQCVYPVPYEMVYNTPEVLSSRLGNQIGVDTINIASTSEYQLSSELQELEVSRFAFPPEHAIEIPTLTTMGASFRFAQMLGLVDELLDLTMSRVLDVSRIPVPLGDLPETLRPTEAQILLPHYPLLDVIPWPSVRTKLICLFSQPDQLRPPIARGSAAIMRLLHSIDDESEGFRIALDVDEYGNDVKSWEVGQAVFKDWWWILDYDIVSNSNRLRSKRGAPKLQIPTT